MSEIHAPIVDYQVLTGYRYRHRSGLQTRYPACQAGRPAFHANVEPGATRALQDKEIPHHEPNVTGGGKAFSPAAFGSI